MTTKTSNNSTVTKNQDLLKVEKKSTEAEIMIRLHDDTPYPLENPGLNPTKQVQIFTKWRQVLPDMYKDITCPLPSPDVIEQDRIEKIKIPHIETCEQSSVQSIITFSLSTKEKSKQKKPSTPSTIEVSIVSTKSHQDDLQKNHHHQIQ